MSIQTKATDYAGLFLVTLSTLMYQLMLSRVFSVTMWYHFAFVAISIAMFGMSVGAVLVYVLPKYFTPGKVRSQMSSYSILFAVTVVFSFLAHLAIPFSDMRTFVGAWGLFLTFSIISVPFISAGIVVTLALTKLGGNIGRLYSADLLGAAAGCIMMIVLLDYVDAPSAVLMISLAPALASIIFNGGSSRNLRIASIAFMVIIGSFAVLNAVMAYVQNPVLRLLWVKTAMEAKPAYEKWNSFSRITISGDSSKPEPPFGWGFGTKLDNGRLVRQLELKIDASAGTILTKFDGSFDSLDYLRYDASNMVHYIRHDANALIIGSGGGRDILSALMFGQKHVTALEINNSIIGAVSGPFGDFTGHLDKNPRVRIINDEARSWLAASHGNFDIIQVSLIDTWAATAAGAFVLTEHSLYTLEAWKSLLEHLSPNGVLTFSRWYMIDQSAEMYRITSLAARALREEGISDPRAHIMIIRNEGDPNDPMHSSIGTILVGRDPFTADDIAKINAAADSTGMQIVLTPDYASGGGFAEIAGRGGDEFIANFDQNISPPTDDNPYFFFTARLSQVLSPSLWRDSKVSPNMKAVLILVVLLLTVLILAGLCIVLPLVLTRRSVGFGGSFWHFVYFAGIGLGYMFVEISQVQRLIIFLGHPAYGLSVLLFGLLLSSGLGSFLSQYLIDGNRRRSQLIALGALLLVIIVFGMLTPSIIRSLAAQPTAIRILSSVLMIAPPGLLMGIAFPFGMSRLAPTHSGLAPWLWGINGAASVLASVLAMVVSLDSGITAAFWTGFAAYLIAVLSRLILDRTHEVINT